ncbi:MAG: tRNA(fMet)-specific endonuclease VapC [Candidatus Methanoperedens nitroreducens]|uniref:Ribonuclease VapC n=1 Tax=Candidatus Methanoperedens nitratireducens TaxID=1392998 RepID=A0A0P7ZF53_9EURY|nr:type II toxin-antitoxin system VapC family toxin [Candidatus Methanoperedens sp. BLZ2]KPQ43376.1 MAG: tRNA(fMet)-specific endonuclease VapC [Candidatus Methanoperedens sp. BLZ1]MBZ0175854.1 type II toxin-antitoxin system VapC family toxin [Candidatus Methanoperedens nitroreducens]MCX9079312.1 type II toxin-antitoxin system VapC family toxin [Candidatus Methanoperedens sp.]
MTVLDTNFLIDVLRDKGNPEAILDTIEHPKTTTINVFELYFGAERSVKKKESISNIDSLIKSMEILEFDMPAAVKAANIHAKLKNSGRTLEIEDLFIAGIVLANNEELLTRDDHFNRIPGLRCRSW